jgi:hypothetical protein
MSKTPEEIATEYANNNHEKHDTPCEWLAAYNGFIAGCHKDTQNIVRTMGENHNAGVSKMVNHIPQTDKMVAYEEKIKELNDIISGLADENEGFRTLWQDAEAAQEQYEARIKELEIELDNWQHAATHGDEGL